MYSNFITEILEFQRYSISDKSNLLDLSKYLLDMSYEYNQSEIRNLSKIKRIMDILSLDVRTMQNLYNSDKLNLYKTELKLSIRLFHEKSIERDLLLESIQ